MRIAFLNHFISYGGAERVVSLLSKYLVERGYEVLLITDIYVPFSYSFDDRVIVKPLFFSPKEKKKSLFTMAANCRKQLKKEKPDIIVGVLPWMTLVAFIASFGLKTKVIASDHTSFDRPVRWHIKFIKRYIYPLVNAVTILTQADADYLGKRLPKKVVMPNPLAFPVVQTINDNTRRKNILAVGRLDVWQVKGFDLLMKAWSKIATDYPDWILEIAGTGGEKARQELQEMSEKLGIADRIKFLGFRKDIDAVMRESSIFALTSRIEGFGMVLIEAMSQGCACVSYDDGGRQREIIRNENEGIVVEGHNVDMLSDVLDDLIQNQQKRIDISVNGLKRADDFNICIVGKKWENLFKTVCCNS